MKYTNLVRRGYVNFTDSEIQSIYRIITNSFKKNHVVYYTDVSVDKISVDTSDMHDVLNIIVYFYNRIDGSTKRNKNGDKILKLTKVSYHITKETGHFLSTPDAPEFQYYVSKLTDGKYIPYKCRRERFIMAKHPFSFGTEFSDLDLGIDDLMENQLKGLF